MQIRGYIWGIFFSTALCWAAWVLILLYINPEASGFVGPLIFYVALFFSLVGTFALIGFYFRVWFGKNEVVYRHVATSFRQGVLLAIAFIGVLILQSFAFLTWWSVLLFVLAVVILELFFLSQSRYQNS